MKNKGILFIGVIGLILSSCTKHEIIPAPEPTVDLEASFIGTIGNQQVEYTEFVNGYEGFSDIAIQSGGGTSNAQYSFALASSEQSDFVKLSLGSITWPSATGTSHPDINSFNAFFKGNDTPNYSNNALSGFEVTYRTYNDSMYYSKENSVFNQQVEFLSSSIIQESDNSGDYSKFICQFDCYVYNEYDVDDGMGGVITQTDSILIENATYKGWFKR